MRSDLRVATFAYGGVPFDTQIDMAVQAEADGWDMFCYWDQANGWTPRAINTPEHTALAHVVPDLDVFYDAPVAIGQAALKTEKIDFLSAVIDCVRRPPYVQALQALTLDHATKGRTTTIFGAGEIKQMRAYGHKRLGASNKMWDTVHILHKWFRAQGEPISYEGREYSVDRALLALQPYGDTPPPIWIAGSGDEVYYLAGALSDGWTTYAPCGVNNDVEGFKAAVDEVKRHARDAGKDPDEVKICFQAMTCLHNDPGVLDELRDQVHVRWMSQMVMPTSNMYKEWGLGPHPMGDDWSYAAKMDRHYAMSEEEVLDICRRTPREATDRVFYTGSVEEVAEMLKPFLDYGVTDLLLMNVAPIAGEEDLRPQLRDAIKALAPV
jgi:alkanesulfonate monooxygenase SsuD/methylene tetrahydromethanopterin reductase-like flavin-dependent oxidoreductase (luciferase family)